MVILIKTIYKFDIKLSKCQIIYNFYNSEMFRQEINI